MTSVTRSLGSMSRANPASVTVVDQRSLGFRPPQRAKSSQPAVSIFEPSVTAANDAQCNRPRVDLIGAEFAPTSYQMRQFEIEAIVMATLSAALIAPPE